MAVPKKLAIIITGNPNLINNNEQADKFYDNLATFFEEIGFDVEFDPGEPYTKPKVADVWIGHSRGADRLKFAEPKTTTIGIGVPESSETYNFPVVNHPDDPMIKMKYKEGEVVGRMGKNMDDTNHYILTPEMRGKILKIIIGK